MIDDKLKKWVEDNKMIVSDSSVDESDIIIIEGVGKFLYLHPFEGNVIDEDFQNADHNPVYMTFVLK